MSTTPPKSFAHGVTHTRPIAARGVHFNAANDAAVTPQQVAEEYRQWHAARWASFQERVARGEASYGGSGYSTTCSLCGGASNSQVCGSCSASMESGVTL